MGESGIDISRGLSSAEAKKRLFEHGLNQLAKPYDVTFLDIFKEEIAEPMIMLLLVVGFFYSLWGKLEDALTILVVICVLVAVEVWNEFRAKKSIAALTKISSPKTRVLRDGNITDVDSTEIVPGDVLILSTGTRITADGIIALSYSLQIDESSLTGESFPAEKKAGESIYAGTLVIAGEGKSVAKATGKETRIGQISTLAKSIKPPKTPLQLSMKALSKQLVFVALFFSIIIPLIGFLRGQDLQTMVLTGLSLAFATIPEELPIIITMVLGLGAYTLSKQSLLIKKLKAAEALGNTTVIVTDKTGTITESVMSIGGIYPEQKQSDVIESAYMAITGLSSTPMDEAIKKKALELGARKEKNIMRERSFGDGRKTKSIVRSDGTEATLYISGSPEEVLGLCKGSNDDALINIDLETEKGRRVIAVGKKIIPEGNVNKSFNELEKDIDFVGLISFQDPPRQGVRETIQKALTAGIKTIMVTGDHPKTAGYIAKEVSIDSDKIVAGKEIDGMSDDELNESVKNTYVFARTSPENKYRIVKALQKNGEIVAVTGDGVNDALALKEADIGIAMGIRGTDAAKEAADIVVADDNYVTIGKGIFEGRKFYDNLRKGVSYYLSVKIALILVFLMPIILGIPFLFAPVQIIILELFMDLAASSAFVAEPEEKTIYTRRPRNPKERLINKERITQIFISGFSLFFAIALTYFYAQTQHISPDKIQTYAFTAWLIGHLLLAYVSRSEKEPLYKIGLLKNKVMNIWAIIVVAFFLLITNIPVAQSSLKVVPLTLNEITPIFLITLLAISWQEIAKMIIYAKVKNKNKVTH
jgi:Ca2+-transporting ATPase